MSASFPEYACAYAKRLAAHSKAFARQIEFSRAELADDGYGSDPFGEAGRAMRCWGLKQRFPDRVLVMTSDRCFVNCRHCTRRGLLEGAQVVRTDEQLRACVDYVKAHPKVRDSGISSFVTLTVADFFCTSLTFRARRVAIPLMT
jgi:L-lysine 2,3-aminomutase